jgi:predicted alpha/beta superfamily hydrolase
MKRITTIALILFITVSCKKKIKHPDMVETFNIQSSNASASYEIKVALPVNYDKQNKKYSTIYVLDGEDNFNFVAHHSKELSNKYSKENALIVSIGYGNDRSFDYTPTKSNHNGGGAEQFFKFIEKELIPKMETDFSADTNRTGRAILGHSFGGLFCVYAFAKHNEVFGNYIILSPSIWYDNEIVLEYELENRANIKNEDQVVYLGIGELENSGRMQAPFEAFYQILNNNYSSIRLAKHSVQYMDHVGSRNPNIIKGLDLYFQNK